MHTPWPIRRRVIARRDGARCGEAAYPCLLPWAMDHAAGTWPVPSHRQEASQGRRPVGPCLAHPATATPDDCTAVGPASRGWGNPAGVAPGRGTPRPR